MACARLRNDTLPIAATRHLVKSIIVKISYYDCDRIGIYTAQAEVHGSVNISDTKYFILSTA